MSGEAVARAFHRGGRPALRAGTLHSTALTEHALARIAALDPLLHSFVLVTRERALADAERADRELTAGIDKGPMHGIPYGLKDIYDTAGIRTTCHSKLLVDNVPGEDSVVEAKLKAGGAVLLGKLATHEFAIGGPSFDLPFPPARNPWHVDHFTGGSSSGSAAAVAAGFTRVAMGSDTGGSIRGPAFYCGIVGLKPTYGRVSRRGVFPLSYTLDHCGPLTWTVEDAALSLQVIAGHDPQDPAIMSWTPASLRGIDHLLVVTGLEAADIGGDGVGEQLDVLRQVAEMAARAAPCGQIETSAPSRRTAPAVGPSTPTIWRARVDLPAPDGPMTPSISPASMRNVTPRRIGLLAPGGR